MPKQTKNSSAYENLKSSLGNGNIGCFYIFHGEEQYLLVKTLEKFRQLLCPGGLDSFNYKRFDEKSISLAGLSEAVETLPAFADRSLIEIHDFDIFKNDEKAGYAELLSDLPDYVCIVFVYAAIQYKPDGRLKIDSGILKNACPVEFIIQDQAELIKWIKRHFRDTGKNISTNDAEYIATITGGFMATLNGEIEKAAAYAKSETVTRADIDAVVTPVLDAIAYKLTDALINRNSTRAVHVLDELFQMNEAPHKLLYSISLKIRQLLAARVCIENGLSKSDLMDLCGIRHEFQARTLMSTARSATLKYCRASVLLCSATALELNTVPDPESRLIELVAKLALR